MSKWTDYGVVIALTVALSALGWYGSEQTGSYALAVWTLHFFGDGFPFVGDAVCEIERLSERVRKYVRFGIVFLNTAILTAATVSLLVETVLRMWDEVFYGARASIDNTLIIYAAGALVGDLVQVRFAHELKHKREFDDHEHLHESQMSHLISDVIASALLVLSAGLMWVSDWTWPDTAATLLGAVVTGFMVVKGVLTLKKMVEGGSPPPGQHGDYGKDYRRKHQPGGHNHRGHAHPRGTHPVAPGETSEYWTGNA